VYLKVLLRPKILIWLMQAAFIRSENVAEAWPASKVPNLIVLWAIGWGHGGVNLDTNTYALLSRIVRTAFQNQT
jgi:hypothetical protein